MKVILVLIVITCFMCECGSNREYNTAPRVDLSDNSNYYFSVNRNHFTMESTLYELLEAGFKLRYNRDTSELVIHGDGVMLSDEQAQLSAGCYAVLPLDYNELLSLNITLYNETDDAVYIDDCKVRGVSISSHFYTTDSDVSFSFLSDIEVGSHKSYIKEVFGECPEKSYYEGMESWLYKLENTERIYFLFSFDTKDYNAYHIQWTNLGY